MFGLGTSKSFADPSPEAPFWAIGDIHGRADLLEQAESIMLREAPGIPAVFVGDYVDRGPDSATVLQLLSSGSEDGDQPIICLMGNHEQMLLDFLDHPERSGPRWLRNGGVATMQSFGISGADAAASPDELAGMAHALLGAMGTDLLAWLRARPLFWQSGNIGVVHAGADPAAPLAEQKPKALLFGHPEFMRKSRRDGLWILHGHTITRKPNAEAGRIAIDTGAYATGRLTCALIQEGKPKFFQT